jgi:phage shock protein PspC (stress-responsive transcriptional regulator)
VNPRRLYRSSDDRILAGVAGGLAAYLDVDPVIVRIVWFLSVFFTGTLTFWAYVVMIFVVPLEPSEWPPAAPWAPGGGPTGGPVAFEAAYAPPAGGPATDAAAAGIGSAPTATAPGTTPPSDTAAPVPGTPPAPAPGGWWGDDWRSQRRQERWQNRAERWQQRAERRELRHGHGGPGLVFGLLLILVGGMLVLNQILPNFPLNLTWPVVIIALGAILVVSSLRFRD